ncbi:hypothetical protein CKN63_12875 [Carnobacterium divergens]|uniref:hypothetical protein n=1 Tax=Lactobacillales TaxID=186826 RepID=UPI00019CF462|nr:MULTISPECIES: hypothetical protein [Lactobacillales]NSW25926.1 hypothetical protein [Enterococcus faecalis]TFI60611.1 hypothetical protein CKN76_13440 [Carnobacterium divergens]TFI61584.1 hypothetical protein CKN59_12440 [Carnobacterium divergens]TFI77618.1 hypothetical protein CKN74_12340 [Carnobacterium divergens]TFJ00664.1 hypothetical protein CKN75_13120 [Carnobacterium divergens]
MKIRLGKFLGLIVLDIFVIGMVREVAFREDFSLPSFILEGITYNFTHFSFLGLIGGLGMIVLSITLFFMAVSFISFNWQQLKSCFQIRKDNQ